MKLRTQHRQTDRQIVKEKETHAKTEKDRLRLTALLLLGGGGAAGLAAAAAAAGRGGALAGTAVRDPRHYRWRGEATG